MGRGKHVNILGTRGLPAAHGGFETFAERLAQFLIGRGWSVSIYCQAEEPGPSGLRQWTDQWRGINRHHIAPRRTGAMGTIEFDFQAVRHVLAQPGVDLILGYNTALFNVMQSLKRRPMVINMDGIEWQRDKWSLPVKVWFFINEIIGANFCGTTIADHPEIAAHLIRRSFKSPIMIPYGADSIEQAPSEILANWGLEPDGYVLSVARIEPENSILEIVQAFACSDVDIDCLIVGKIDPSNPYHQAVCETANPRTKFPGAIYDRKNLSALRYYARGHLHGHTVGGTNPTLVEALAAGNAILAHDNKFNRWTAGPVQFYFTCVETCARQIELIFHNEDALDTARKASRTRHQQAFEWENILGAYEALLERTLAKH